MYISAAEALTVNKSPAELLPKRIRRLFYLTGMEDFNEIRLRCGQPVVISLNGIKYYLSASGRITKDKKNATVVMRKDIDEAMDILTDCSVYSYKEEIGNGFVTANGGHRVGVCGTVTPEGNFIREISGLNYRFAKQCTGCADEVSEKIYNNGNVLSTLILSKPGCGKTTFLRELIRRISDYGCNVSVVDERCEIAAMSHGMSGFDVGINTDVLSQCKKIDGVKLMLRSMSPDIIAIDEFDLVSEGFIIPEIIKSGVSIFATVHGYETENFSKDPVLKNFGCYILLSDRNGPGTIEECTYV